MIIQIIFCVVLITLLAYHFNPSKRVRSPPGSLSIPYLGGPFPLHEESVKKYIKKYGPIFMCQLGVVKFLFIGDFEKAKEALSLSEYSNRPEWRLFGTIINDKLEPLFKGLANANGLRWQHNRRFALRHLRDLGLGKSRMEYAILHEAEQLVNAFSKMADKPTPFPVALNIAVLNVIWQLIASHRYDFDDKEVEIFLKKVTDVQQNFFLLSLNEIFPITKYIVPSFVLDWLFGFDRSVDVHRSFRDIAMPFIEEHKRTVDYENPRDYIDDYLVATKESNGEEFFEEHDLLRSLLDLFSAGADTVGNLIKWIILYMIKYPEFQEKAQNKIDEVVPKDVQPNLDHRPSLVYIDALINEVQRMASLVSFGIFRETTKDVTINGYFVPKNTAVFPLPGISHYDANYWKNPNVFNPERFIEEDGRLKLNVSGYQPFGLGRRQCLGESLAKMELYLFTTSILQKFTFHSPAGANVDLSSIGAPFFNLSKPQKIVIRKRI